MRFNVGILTYYFATNFGAVLQCYALQEYCKTRIDDVAVIDYRPASMVKPRSLKGIIKDILYVNNFNNKFNRFQNKELNVVSLKNQFDLVIVGSDQVWNTNINKNDSFWFKPDLDYKTIVSYAASIGIEYDNKAVMMLKRYLNFLQDYKKVTVREQTAQTLLYNEGIYSEIVCDPTLLFYYDNTPYLRLLRNHKKMMNEKYVLVFAVEQSNEFDITFDDNRIKPYKKVSIHPTNKHFCDSDIYLDDIGPEDFIWLIQNAEYVITNSFHGLAFSYIFRKKCFAISHGSLSSRQDWLIAKSGFAFHAESKNIKFIDCNQNTVEMRNYILNSQLVLNEILTNN